MVSQLVYLVEGSSCVPRRLSHWRHAAGEFGCGAYQPFPMELKEGWDSSHASRDHSVARGTAGDGLFCEGELHEFSGRGNAQLLRGSSGARIGLYDGCGEW